MITVADILRVSVKEQRGLTVGSAPFSSTFFLGVFPSGSSPGFTSN